jgi:hypothetical protein
MALMQATTIATIDANCANVSRRGSIARDGSRYIILVDGSAVAQAGSVDSAAHRLAATLRKALPREQDRNWGVAAHCILRTDVGLVFGNQVTGGGGGGMPNQCVAEIITEYRRGEDNLERALEFAARLLARCCGGS